MTNAAVTVDTNTNFGFYDAMLSWDVPASAVPPPVQQFNIYMLPIETADPVAATASHTPAFVVLPAARELALDSSLSFAPQLAVLFVIKIETALGESPNGAVVRFNDTVSDTQAMWRYTGDTSGMVEPGYIGFDSTDMANVTKVSVHRISGTGQNMSDWLDLVVEHVLEVMSAGSSSLFTDYPTILVRDNEGQPLLLALVDVSESTDEHVEFVVQKVAVPEGDASRLFTPEEIVTINFGDGLSLPCAPSFVREGETCVRSPCPTGQSLTLAGDCFPDTVVCPVGSSVSPSDDKVCLDDITSDPVCPVGTSLLNSTCVGAKSCPAGSSLSVDQRQCVTFPMCEGFYIRNASGVCVFPPPVDPVSAGAAGTLKLAGTATSGLLEGTVTWEAVPRDDVEEYVVYLGRGSEPVGEPLGVVPYGTNEFTIPAGTNTTIHNATTIIIVTQNRGGANTDPPLVIEIPLSGNEETSENQDKSPFGDLGTTGFVSVLVVGMVAAGGSAACFIIAGKRRRDNDGAKKRGSSYLRFEHAPDVVPPPPLSTGKSSIFVADGALFGAKEERPSEVAEYANSEPVPRPGMERKKTMWFDSGPEKAWQFGDGGHRNASTDSLMAAIRLKSDNIEDHFYPTRSWNVFTSFLDNPEIAHEYTHTEEFVEEED